MNSGEEHDSPWLFLSTINDHSLTLFWGPGREFSCPNGEVTDGARVTIMNADQNACYNKQQQDVHTLPQW